MGSVLKPCRTLFVGSIACRKYRDPKACEACLWRQFGEWGEVENVNLISRLSIAFVRYRSRAGAEFGKEAMGNQTLEQGVSVQPRVCSAAWASSYTASLARLLPLPLPLTLLLALSVSFSPPSLSFSSYLFPSPSPPPPRRPPAAPPPPPAPPLTLACVLFDLPMPQEVINVRWAYDDPNPVALEAAERADADAVVNMLKMRGVVALAPGESAVTAAAGSAEGRLGVDAAGDAAAARAEAAGLGAGGAEAAATAARAAALGGAAAPPLRVVAVRARALSPLAPCTPSVSYDIVRPGLVNEAYTSFCFVLLVQCMGVRNCVVPGIGASARRLRAAGRQTAPRARAGRRHLGA